MSIADISNSNSYLGLYAGYSDSDYALQNTYLGYSSGTNLVNSTKSTFIGANTSQSAGQTFTQSTAVGYGANVTASNQIVLGTPSEFVVVPGTAAATSMNSGALQVGGGLGVSGDIYCRNLYGNASAVITTSDNTNTTCYLPFTKTTAGTNQTLYVDDTTGPLTYNPATSVLSCGSATISGYTSKTNPIITTTATLLPSQSGSLIEFGNGPYTVTLPDPSGNNNGNLCYQYNIWLNTAGYTITLATPTGLFYGPSGNGQSTIALTQAAYGHYLYIASDRYNWFVYANNAVTTVSDNTNTTCYIPFTKTTAGANQPLCVDDTTGPLTYNPSTATMSLGSINASGNVYMQSSGNSGVSFSAGSGVSALGYNATAGTYSSSAAAGDLVLRADTNKRLILQSGSGNAAIIIDGSNAILQQPGYTTLPTYTSSQIGYQVSATMSTTAITSAPATPYNCGSLTLGPGVWILNAYFSVQTTTQVIADITAFMLGFSTSSTAFPVNTYSNETQWGNGTKLGTTGFGNVTTAQYFSKGMTRVFQVSSSTTYYFLAYLTYTSTSTISPLSGGSYFTATRIG